jgi:ubiquitin-conjugating enzyme E2 M
LIIWPHEESIWYGGKFEFELTFPPEYPSRQPKAMCLTKLFHPNIDLNGNVCLNVLKLEAEGGWTAAKGISDIRDGLFHLFNEPNYGDPLNKEAADLLFNNRTEFISYVKKTLKGGTHNNV